MSELRQLLRTSITAITKSQTNTAQLLLDIDTAIAVVVQASGTSDEELLQLRASLAETKSEIDTAMGTASQLREKVERIKPASATSDEMEEIRKEVRSFRVLLNGLKTSATDTGGGEDEGGQS